MRFIKGCKVEVFSKREVSAGSWRPAEIISGNGHTYTVKYDKVFNEPVIGWVSRKAIRPRPPLEVTNWASGDIVEVFDKFSWKSATIVKGLGQKRVLVELYESLVNLIVNVDEIRVRHSWEDGKWIVMGKRSLNSEDGKHYDMWTGVTHGWKDSSPHWPTKWEYSERSVRKYRRVEKEGQSHQAKENPTEDHYRIPSQSVVNGKKRRRSSLIIRFPVQRIESNQPADSLFSASTDPNDKDSDLCSVGSCSSTDSWRLCINYSQATDRNGDISDAESSCAPINDEQQHIILETVEKAAAATIHQLELQGYRCTLRALHASGPLSWEQQSLIRNVSQACLEAETSVLDKGAQRSHGTTSSLPEPCSEVGIFGLVAKR